MKAPDDHLNISVSRETCQRLEHFVALLEKWNRRINLVSNSSIATVWQRHVNDAVQLIPLIPIEARTYVDLGSGGGFPGVVIALIASEKLPEMSTTLIESDTRKAAFLRTVLRETDISGHVLAKRAEDIEPMKADIITARAVADLPKLLNLVARHLGADGTALLQKGAAWKAELTSAQKLWSFSLETHKSNTNQDAVILKIGDIAHV